MADSKISIKNDIRNEFLTTKQFDELLTQAKSIIGAINELTASTGSGFFQNELKWVLPNYDLPAPWKKANLNPNLTLIQYDPSTTDRFSNGKVINHYHDHSQNIGDTLNTVPLITNDGTYEIFEGQAVAGNKKFVTISQSSSTIGKSKESSSPNNDNIKAPSNYAAGYYAVLWIYDPKNMH